ncbi:ABC transporter ATP-binding protein [Desulforhopalus sp. 52FAK]
MGAVVLRNIEKRYGEQLACTGINLDIQKGDFFTFLGPSGCGKTTILRLIAGFITPENGSITIDGRDITSLLPEQRDVGMVFQNYALFPFLSVRENIEYGLKIQKQPTREVRQKTDYYLSMVGLKGYDNRQISELSGGEQQRVAFARSLAIEPRVLLLDEPLSNLDARLRDTMRAELISLQKKLGITTIFVTHDQTEALTMSDKLAVFNRGQCIQVGTPEQIYQQPTDSFVAQFIGETNLFSIYPEGDRYLLENGKELVGITGSGWKYISIRPEQVILSTEKKDEPNVFDGVIQEKRYNGVSTEFLVRAEGLDFKVTRLNDGKNTDNFTTGQQVFLHFRTPDVQLLHH